MKYLQIKDNKGQYWDGKKYQDLDKIDKDGLLALLNAAETNDFEMDTYNEGLLGNKAHQIIYENIHSKFQQFLNDKGHFKTEVDNLYKEAIGKYSADIRNESLDDVDKAEDEEKEKELNPDDIPF